MIFDYISRFPARSLGFDMKVKVSSFRWETCIQSNTPPKKKHSGSHSEDRILATVETCQQFLGGAGSKYAFRIQKSTCQKQQKIAEVSTSLHVVLSQKTWTLPQSLHVFRMFLMRLFEPDSFVVFVVSNGFGLDKPTGLHQDSPSNFQDEPFEA